MTAFGVMQQLGFKFEERTMISADGWIEKQRETEDMVEYQEMLAASGNSEAATAVGDYHLHGVHGVAQDYGEAHRLLEYAVGRNERNAFGRFLRFFAILRLQATLRPFC